MNQKKNSSNHSLEGLVKGLAIELFPLQPDIPKRLQNAFDISVLPRCDAMRCEMAMSCLIEMKCEPKGGCIQQVVIKVASLLTKLLTTCNVLFKWVLFSLIDNAKEFRCLISIVLVMLRFT